MSFLAPLFMLGAAAVALPILFHLIRRTPRGRRVFSSLMFLTPSPPRLTRRSRIDNLLLLLLRGLALTLLAAAFARPFLRAAADLSFDGVSGRRIAILVDTSASMRADGIWQQARQRVRQIVADLEPADEVALFAFDTKLQPLVEFDQRLQREPARRNELLEAAIRELQPGWRSTDLGAALVEVAELLAVEQDRNQGDARAQIVLISDIQQGADREALHAIDWPEDVFVDIQSVAGPGAGNASLRLLAQEGDREAELRVRVTNTQDAVDEQFRLSWSTARSRPEAQDEILVHVPAGQTRVVRLPRPKNLPDADRVVLAGDGRDFDNTFFVAPQPREKIDVVYLGDDASEDADGLHYFLAAALDQIPHADVTLSAVGSDAELDLPADAPPRLIVADAIREGSRLAALHRYVAGGGALLLVPSSGESVPQLVSFNPTVGVVSDGESRDATHYVMIAEIDFSHPVFADFAPADYSDFTKIHFWKHTQFDIQDPDSARVLARFDNGFPALWEQDFEQGTLFVLASGWRLDDSQLALSSKFVPLLMGIIEQAGGGRKVLPSYVVGQAVPLPATNQPSNARVVAPDGAEIPLSQDAAYFDAADAPGIYQLVRQESEQRFAVNLASAESDTTPLDVQQLEAFGVRLGEQPAQSDELDRRRQLRDIELESRQKIWRWLVVVVLCVLGFETWLAGRKSSGQNLRAGERT